MQPLLKDEARPEQHPVPQDCSRPACCRPLGDQVCPPRPESLEAHVDELTRIALADPEAQNLDRVSTEPTFWRAVAVLLFAVLALAVVFVLK